MKRKMFAGVSLALSVLLAVGVRTVFRGCAMKEDGTWMCCHTAQQAVFFLALGMSLLSAAEILRKEGKNGFLLSSLTAVLAAGAAVLPGRVTGICRMDIMRCFSVMRPFVILVCILIIACAAGNFIRALRRK